MAGTGLLSYLSLGALWGTNYLALHHTNRSIPPFTMVAVRLSLGAVFYGLWNCCFRAVHGKQRRGRTHPLTLFKLMGLGFINLTLPLALVRIAVRCVPLAMIGVISTTRPIFALFFSLVLTHDPRPLHWLRPVGMAVGIVGVIIMTLHRTQQEQLTSSDIFDCNDAESNGYTFLVLLASCLSGLCAVLAEKFLSGVDDFVVAAGQTVFGALFAMLLSIVVDFRSPPYGYQTYIEDLRSGDRTVFIWLLYLATASTCISWVLFFRLNRTIGPVKLLSVVFVENLVAMTEGVAFMHDWRTANSVQMAITLFGGLVVVSGTCFCMVNEGAEYALVKTVDQYRYLRVRTEDTDMGEDGLLDDDDSDYGSPSPALPATMGDTHSHPLIDAAQSSFNGASGRTTTIGNRRNPAVPQ